MLTAFASNTRKASCIPMYRVPMFQSIRCFAAGSEKLELPKAPEIPLVVPGERGKLAGKLYQDATLDNKLDTVDKEVSDIVNKRNKVLIDALTKASQIVDPKEREKLVNDACATSKTSQSTVDLLHCLLKVDTLDILPDVYAAFSDMVLTSRGHVIAYVTTAKPLSRTQESSLGQALTKQFLGSGKKIILRIKEDSRLLGGIKVRVGDVFVDFSLQSLVDSKVGSLYR